MFCTDRRAAGRQRFVSFCTTIQFIAYSNSLQFTLFDQISAMEIRYVGGVFGGNIKPTPFLCLTLKMLQIQPEKDIVVEFIKNEEFKYVRALGAFYLRLTGTAVDVYKYLEPLYNDNRKLRTQNREGQFVIVHMDEYIDELLRNDRVCDVILPRIQKRQVLEENNELEMKVSALEDDLDGEASDDEPESKQTVKVDVKKKHKVERERERSRSRERSRERDHREKYRVPDRRDRRPSREPRERDRSYRNERDRDRRDRGDRRDHHRRDDRRAHDRDDRRDHDRDDRRDHDRDHDRNRYKDDRRRDYDDRRRH